MRKLLLLLIAAFLIACNPTDKKLRIKDYPELKLGFTTQNFQKAMTLSVESLTELIEFASRSGFHFIEIRDDVASLTTDQCRVISEKAISKGIEIIYEFQTNLLDPGYFEIFNKALENAVQFPEPVIMRAMISKSEFASDPQKKGWSSDEFLRICKIADSCCSLSESKNVKFLIENSDESFFGDGENYYGLADFFNNTEKVGLQFDIGNPFRGSARVKSDTEMVIRYLSTLGDRWVSSHLKTISEVGGTMQPVLTLNPLTVDEVIAQMGRQNVKYVALELLAVENKEECFKNHEESIKSLMEKGILE